MIAYITRTLLAIQIFVAIGISILAWKFWHIDHYWSALALGVSVVLAVRLLITANGFFLAWIYRSETPAELQLNWLQACKLFAREFHATIWNSSWTMPFYTFSRRHVKEIDEIKEIKELEIKELTDYPVLLVHGWGCNSGYWDSMSKALMQTYITHHTVDLEPVLGSIDAYASVLQRAIDTLLQETGQKKAVIVAHSMGGLAVRAYLRDHGAAQVAKVITLGTPHHGTVLAHFGAGLNCQQMLRFNENNENNENNDKNKNTYSTWLQQLGRSEGDAIRALFVSIYSYHDNIIAPQTSSHLPGAKNIAFHGIGHVALGWNPMIQATVIKEILLTSKQETIQLVMKHA